MLTLFSGTEIEDFTKSQRNYLHEEILKFTEEYLHKVTDIQLTEYLNNKYLLELPIIGKPEIIKNEEVKIDVRNDPNRHIYDRSKPCYILGNKIEIHLPFSGDSSFFNYKPSYYDFNPPRVEQIGHNYLSFAFQGVSLEAEKVNKDLEYETQQITKYLTSLKTTCDKFNNELENLIKTKLEARRERHRTNQQLLKSIGLPIRQRENAPLTYILPDIRKNPQIKKPLPNISNQSLEPTLAENEYENILKIIRSMVGVIEKSPQAFQQMNEEDLRWHFVVQLNGQYEGRATGETFNYQGKTDILIRENDKNVFIAECKVWKGENSLSEAIDQILGYLQWRDTKAALLIFNRNKSFSDVLGKVLKTAKEHKNYKRFIKQFNETEWRFIFKNNNDEAREIQLAIMVFEVPKKK